MSEAFGLTSSGQPPRPCTSPSPGWEYSLYDLLADLGLVSYYEPLREACLTVVNPLASAAFAQQHPLLEESQLDQKVHAQAINFVRDSRDLAFHLLGSEAQANEGLDYNESSHAQRRDILSVLRCLISSERCELLHEIGMSRTEQRRLRRCLDRHLGQTAVADGSVTEKYCGVFGAAPSRLTTTAPSGATEGGGLCSGAALGSNSYSSNNHTAGTVSATAVAYFSKIRQFLVGRQISGASTPFVSGSLGDVELGDMNGGFELPSVSGRGLASASMGSTACSVECEGEGSSFVPLSFGSALLSNGSTMAPLPISAGSNRSVMTSTSSSSSPCNSDQLSRRSECQLLTQQQQQQLIIPRSHIILSEQLGCGEFGVVRQGVWLGTTTDPTSSAHDGPLLLQRVPVAVKCLAREKLQANATDFLKEAAIMQTVSHPHVVRLYGVVRGTHELLLVTELAAYRSLLECLRNPPVQLLRELQTSCCESDVQSLPSPCEGQRPTFCPQTLFEFGRQIAHGMAYFESRRLIHRDLAARNVLVFACDLVKISDFGLSRTLLVGKDYYQTSFNASLRLPIAWCAPESVNFLRFTSASDVWAFGVTLWELFSYGAQPWCGLSGRQILAAVDEPRGERLAQPEACPTELYALMLRCWSHRPTDRPTFAHIADALDGSSSSVAPVTVRARRAQPASAGLRPLLGFQAGDTITVLDRSSPDLWKGFCRGAIGWFRASATAPLLSLTSRNRCAVEPNCLDASGDQKSHSCPWLQLQQEQQQAPQPEQLQQQDLHGHTDDCAIMCAAPEPRRAHDARWALSAARDHQQLSANQAGKGRSRCRPQRDSNSDMTPLLRQSLTDDASQTPPFTPPPVAMDSAGGRSRLQHEYQRIANVDVDNHDHGARTRSCSPFEVSGPPLCDEVFRGTDDTPESSVAGSLPATGTGSGDISSITSGRSNIAWPPKEGSTSSASTVMDTRPLIKCRSPGHIVKPISPTDEQALDTAIHMAKELASRTLQQDHQQPSSHHHSNFHGGILGGGNSSGPLTPTRKHSGPRFFIFHSGHGLSHGKSSAHQPGAPGHRRHFSDMLDSMSRPLAEVLPREVADVYKALVEKGELGYDPDEEEETNDRIGSSSPSSPAAPFAMDMDATGSSLETAALLKGVGCSASDQEGSDPHDHSQVMTKPIDCDRMASLPNANVFTTSREPASQGLPTSGALFSAGEPVASCRLGSENVDDALASSPPPLPPKPASSVYPVKLRQHRRIHPLVLPGYESSKADDSSSLVTASNHEAFNRLKTTEITNNCLQPVHQETVGASSVTSTNHILRSLETNLLPSTTASLPAPTPIVLNDFGSCERAQLWPTGNVQDNQSVSTQGTAFDRGIRITTSGSLPPRPSSEIAQGSTSQVSHIPSESLRLPSATHDSNENDASKGDFTSIRQNTCMTTAEATTEPDKLRASVQNRPLAGDNDSCIASTIQNCSAIVQSSKSMCLSKQQLNMLDNRNQFLMLPHLLGRTITKAAPETVTVSGNSCASARFRSVASKRGGELGPPVSRSSESLAQTANINARTTGRSSSAGSGRSNRPPKAPVGERAAPQSSASTAVGSGNSASLNPFPSSNLVGEDTLSCSRDVPASLHDTSRFHCSGMITSNLPAAAVSDSCKKRGPNTNSAQRGNSLHSDILNQETQFMACVCHRSLTNTEATVERPASLQMIADCINCNGNQRNLGGCCCGDKLKPPSPSSLSLSSLTLRYPTATPTSLPFAAAMTFSSDSAMDVVALADDDCNSLSGRPPIKPESSGGRSSRLGLADWRHVSCEDLLEFSAPRAAARRTQGRARGIDSDEVHIMQKVLANELVPAQDCLAALNVANWNVHKAIKLARLRRLLMQVRARNCQQQSLVNHSEQSQHQQMQSATVPMAVIDIPFSETKAVLENTGWNLDQAVQAIIGPV